MPEDTVKRNKRQQDWINANRDRINLTFAKGFKDRVQTAATAVGLSVSQYVERAVDNQIIRDSEHTGRTIGESQSRPH